MEAQALGLPKGKAVAVDAKGYPVVLRGVVGSTAYGLAREGSDVDELGVFAAPARHVAGLFWSSDKETVHRTGPEVDYTLHEVGKFIRLALRCNPTVTELLWLESYTVHTAGGELLIGARESLLSRDLVRDAYLGYARAQASRLRAFAGALNAKEEEGEDPLTGAWRRRAKHGRHMLRLLRQGRQLLEEGQLTVRVDDPEEYWAFDNYTATEMLDVFEREAELTERAAERSSLQTQPDRKKADAILNQVRQISVQM